jgi:non-specific serine/threonine protein kinase
MERLDRELPNLRAAIQCADELAAAGDATAAILDFRLASGIWWYLHIRGHFREGLGQIQSAWEHISVLQASIRASMSPNDWANLAARALLLQGAYNAWPFEEIDSRAVLMMKASVDLYRELGQRRDFAFALNVAGYGAQRIGDFDEAHAMLTEAVAAAREFDDPRNLALALQGLGMISLRRGDYPAAEPPVRESLRLFSDIGDERSIAAATATLGAVLLRQGDRERGTEFLRKSLRIRDAVGDKGGIAWCFEWLAEAALGETGQHAGPLHAARLLAAAQALRSAISSPIDPVDRPDNARRVAAVQARVSDPAFVVAWESGRTMALQDVVTLALSTDEPQQRV